MYCLHGNSNNQFQFFAFGENVFGQQCAPGQKQVCAKQFSSTFWVGRRAGDLS
jgi:hypothetical protein